MTKLNSARKKKNIISDIQRNDFTIFANIFDEWCFKRWYFLVFGPYFIMKIIGIVADYNLSLTIYKYGFQKTCAFAPIICSSRSPIDRQDLIYLSVVVTLAIMSIFFIQWVKSIPVVFRYLVNNQLLGDNTNPNLQQQQLEFFQEYQLALRNPKRFWLYLIVLGITVSLTAIPFSSTFTNYDWSLFPSQVTIRLILAYDLIYNVFSLSIWAYFVAGNAWLFLITARFTGLLTEKFKIKIRPNHPDKCGGLRPLGNLCFGVALPILIGIIFLGIYASGIIVDKGLPITNAANIGLFFFALPIAYFAFFSPMWKVHIEMKEQKSKYEEGYYEQLTRLENGLRIAVNGNNGDATKTAKENLDAYRTFDPDKMSYPTWPFNRSILLKFLTPQIIPILSLVIQLNEPVQKALEKILSIIPKF